MACGMKWQSHQAAFILYLLTAMVYVSSDLFPDPQAQNMDATERKEVLKELRSRWGAADIVRDLHHIKEDMKRITKLQDDGDLSTNEALFYFLRMHDFDDNGKLDGHELIAAIRHSAETDPKYVMPIEEIENVVDSFFKYDDNLDGFISYPELRRHLSEPERQ